MTMYEYKVEELSYSTRQVSSSNFPTTPGDGACCYWKAVSGNKAQGEASGVDEDNVVTTTSYLVAHITYKYSGLPGREVRGVAVADLQELTKQVVNYTQNTSTLTTTPIKYTTSAEVLKACDAAIQASIEQSIQMTRMENYQKLARNQMSSLVIHPLSNPTGYDIQSRDMLFL